MAVAQTLPGMPLQPLPHPAREIAAVLRWRDKLMGVSGAAGDIEPHDPGFVLVPVDLFERLAAALILEESR